MMKLLKIDCYTDGYNASHLNCSDVPLAGATGCYNFENYYFFCFYYCYFHNWGIENSESYLGFRNEILKKMGLMMKPHTVKNGNDLISLIKHNIDNSHPIFMLPNYNALFYSNDYLSNKRSRHGIVISGYDEEKSIIIIHDDIHIRGISGNPTLQGRGQALLKFQLREDMIIDIWKMSSDTNIYSIEPIGIAQVNNYGDLVSDILDRYKFRQSKLVNFVENYTSLAEKLKEQSYAEYIMKSFCNSVNVLFDIFEKAFKQANDLNSYINFKNEYKKFRQLLISKLTVNAYRGKNLSKDDETKILKDITSWDNQLLSLVSDLYTHYIKHKDSHIVEQTNYALYAKASASSEFYSSGVDNLYGASHAVNGKWENIRTDTWISSDAGIIHWLKVDLTQPRTVNKFVIRHRGRQGYNTVDFKIQGRNSGEKWKDIVNVTDNKSDITVHEVMPCSYRYFRIYITSPSLLDFRARINELEIWGDTQ